MNNKQLVEKLDEIEKEITELKIILVKGIHYTPEKKAVSLKGLLSGMKFTEADILEAKKSLFKLA